MALFNACLARNNAQRARAQAAQPYQMVRLNKDGTPSKMHNAARGFATQIEASAHIAIVRGLNPGLTLRYSLNGTEV